MLTVIGCGNTWRGDDGVGNRVVARLLAVYGERLPAGVRILDAGTRGTEVLLEARGSDALVIIDACRTGAEPGTLFELSADQLAKGSLPSLNCHDFRWDHALALGRQLYPDEFPRDVVIHLIEAGHLGFGEGLSRPVQAAVDLLVDKVRSCIDRRESAFT